MNDLERLFSLRGIAPSFWNYKGEHVQVPEMNRRLIVEAMGGDVSTAGAITKELNMLEADRFSTWLPALSIVDQNEPTLLFCVPAHLLNKPARLSIASSSDTILEQDINFNALQEVDVSHYNGTDFSTRSLPLSINILGYYQLMLRCEGELQSTSMAICPNACFLPQWLESPTRYSGVIVQLYAVRSDTNFGIGDLADLKQLITNLAHVGFDSVGLNPLHALLPTLEDNCSPYSPSNRLFINPLYVALHDVPEYQTYFDSLDEKTRGIINDKAKVLRDQKYVDYVSIKKLKYNLFLILYNLLKSDSDFQLRYDAFKAFVSKVDISLIRFALSEAMRSANANYDDIVIALSLPEGSVQLKQLIQKYNHIFYLELYAQWLAQSQFKEVQLLSNKLGLEIGIVNDLAVGADRTGSEVLSNLEAYVSDAAVGAPPDEIAPVGQNWGLPPIDPIRLKRSGYSHFIKLLQTNMANCGALRIDHVMGLMRLWWCPPKAHADKGAYVYYPFDEILSLLKLESHLNKCAVIGEDLGIVPENFRETLRAANVLSNKVFYFERSGYATFTPPCDYEPFALAMINNHDVPTLASWWNGEDITLRDELNAIEVGKTADDLRHIRNDEKANLVSHLIYCDMYPSHWQGQPLDKPADRALVFAIIDWVAQAKSKLFVIQLEDLTLMTEPVNVPGTFKEYPNWKRKIEKNLDEIFSDTEIVSFLQNISTKRKNI